MNSCFSYSNPNFRLGLSKSIPKLLFLINKLSIFYLCKTLISRANQRQAYQHRKDPSRAEVSLKSWEYNKLHDTDYKEEQNRDRTSEKQSEHLLPQKT